MSLKIKTKQIGGAGLRFIESVDKKGIEWDVVMMTEGLSDTGFYYPGDVLEKSKSVFEGVKCYAYEFTGKFYDHLPDGVKRNLPSGTAKNIVGWFDNVRFKTVSENGETKKALVARFHISKNAQWLSDLMVDAWNRGKKDLLGFSIDAFGDAVQRLWQGIKVQWVQSIKGADSVDLVTSPAAGGQFLRLVASRKHPRRSNGMDKLLAVLIAAIKALDPALIEGEEENTLQETQLTDFFTKALEGYNAETLAEKTLKAGFERAAAVLKDGNSESATAALESLVAGTGFPEGSSEPPTEPGADGKDGKDGKNGADGEGLDADDLKDIKEATAEMKESVRQFKVANTEILVQKHLMESKLPEASIQRLKESYKDKIADEKEVLDAIESEVEYLGKLSGSGDVMGLGNQFRESYQVGADMPQKLVAAMDGFFENEDITIEIGGIKTKVPRFRSFKEAFSIVYGGGGMAQAGLILRESQAFIPEDFRNGAYSTEASRFWGQDVSGSFRESQQRFTEATASDWAQILGDSITRKMLKEYALPALNDWRKIVSDIGNIADFRTNRRTRMGGYGTLATVAEEATYDDLTIPTDEEATYSISKKGGIQNLSLEMIANDDVGAIRKIPVKLGRAAAQTLYRGVFDLLANNSNIYDGNALADSGNHSNSGTTALSSSELTTARRQMIEQTAYGDLSEVLGMANVPKFLLFPPELEELANKLSQSAVFVNTATGYSTGSALESANTPNIHKGIEPLLVPYWTDADNWWVVGDPGSVPTMEVGFFNGREEPELFVQDQPNVGSAFTADKIQYKIRHIWGVTVLDWRGFWGAIV